MKKFALISLLTIYSLATVGFSLKEFYCCGKLKSVSMAFSQDTKQNCSKSSDKKGCCDNRYHFYKVKDNHFAGDTVDVPAKHFTDLTLFTPTIYQTLFASQQVIVSYRSNAPPLRSGVSTYIFNCVFRV